MLGGWAMSQSMAVLGGENSRTLSECRSNLASARAPLAPTAGIRHDLAYDGYNLNGLRTAADRHVAIARRRSAAAAPRGDMRTSMLRTLSVHGS